MDTQKDVQPPKQQPMIYICGGKGTYIHKVGVFYFSFEIITLHLVLNESLKLQNTSNPKKQNSGNPKKTSH